MQSKRRLLSILIWVLTPCHLVESFQQTITSTSTGTGTGTKIPRQQLLSQYKTKILWDARTSETTLNSKPRRRNQSRSEQHLSLGVNPGYSHSNCNSISNDSLSLCLSQRTASSLSLSLAQSPSLVSDDHNNNSSNGVNCNGDDIQEQKDIAKTNTNKASTNANTKKVINKAGNRMGVLLVGYTLLSIFTLLMFNSGPGAWKYYLAGGICAAFSHAITTPVDVIKTRKQLDESLKDLGMIKSGLKIIKTDGGINALLAGLGPTTYGYLFEGAVKFGVYEVMKPNIRSLLSWSAQSLNVPFLNSKLITFALSGGLAGTAASIILCPMEALRIRMVADHELAVGGWVDSGMNMIDNEGIAGLWKCLPAMLCKQVPYTITKNVSFDIITTFAYGIIAEGGRAICGRTKFIIPLFSAMLASALSCISSQPGDMLLSVMNAKEGGRTMFGYAKSILKNDGVGGFFVGIRERFLHVGLIVTMQLLIYDFVKRLVGIAATGL